MSETTPTAIIPMDAFTERLESGLIVPMHADRGLEIVDCGDVRPLTNASEGLRQALHGDEVIPGRYFGGSMGLGATALMTVAAQTGERFIDDFVSEYSPEAFASFSSDLSRRAVSAQGPELNVHSARANEGNDSELDLDRNPDIPLGCKFATYAGVVLMLAGNERALQEAKAIASLTGTGNGLPLDEASEGARILSRHIGSGFSVGRKELRHAAEHGHMTHAVLEGDPVPNEATAAVIDMAGYRSSAYGHIMSGVPRYHHTPGIAVSELPSLLPEYKLDPRLMEASGLLIGVATSEALSGTDNPRALSVEVIPHEYSLAA